SLELRPGASFSTRTAHDPDCTGAAKLAQVAPAALDGLVKLTAAPDAHSCLLRQPHGTAILLRIDRADASLLTRLTQAARRVLQARLPLERETDLDR
ncbi:MAG: hypothetical protein AAF679_05780, partial [Pseudomonadota bacterium]